MLKHLSSTTSRHAVLIVLLAFVSVVSFAQQINLSLERVTVRKALEYLQREYNYSVSVRSDEIDIDRIVSVKSQGGASLTSVLEQIFAGQDVEYSINGNSVFVKAKKVAKAQSARRTVRGKVLDYNRFSYTCFLICRLWR